MKVYYIPPTKSQIQLAFLFDIILLGITLKIFLENQG